MQVTNALTAVSTGMISDFSSPLHNMERITPLPAPIKTPVGPFILSTQPGAIQLLLSQNSRYAFRKNIGGDARKNWKLFGIKSNLNNVNIPSKTKIKYLGVHLYNFLYYNFYIMGAIEKASKP
uniref:Uncharacterized protein n=1 Tax=Glossina pallidipes TaxID=7398 RepID=A0A1A9ZGT6_GLOPL